MTDTKRPNALEELELLVRARYPIIYVVSWEEERVLGLIRTLCHERSKRLFEWSFVNGLVEHDPVGSPRSGRPADRTRDPLNALDEVTSAVEPSIYVFKDLHPFFTSSNFATIRKLKETAQHVKENHKTIILLSPLLEIPPELEKEITVVDFPLPAVKDLSTLLDGILLEIENEPGIVVDLPDRAREQLLTAALGLTLNEAENVFAKILVSDRRLCEKDIDSVFAEKRQVIRRNGLLDYYDSDVAFSEVGGLDNLKAWLQQRAVAHSDEARRFGLPPPRGLFLLGVQGCGKSLCARAVASQWRMPLLRLDVGRMFGSLVGSSEENMRRALRVADSVAPVVLWLDEIDKALAGTSSSSDSGTAARVFGTFLTWLSEKTTSVFVIATANSIADLPPELLRKGRFDEIFFVDLPSVDERRQIFAIQIRRRKRDPKLFDLDALAAASQGFSGAEIEESVIAGLYDAFARGEELSTELVDKALRESVPLSRTLEDELSRLRAWAEGRARWAASREEVTTQAAHSKFDFST